MKFDAAKLKGTYPTACRNYLYNNVSYAIQVTYTNDVFDSFVQYVLEVTVWIGGVIDKSDQIAVFRCIDLEVTVTAGIVQRICRRLTQTRE